jgi:ankyrin repeat protein
MGEVAAIRELVARTPADLERRMDLANRRRMPMHLAVVKKKPESLTALLDLGANTESLDEAGFTPLDQAALNGETAMAQMLLDRGAKIRLPAAVALGRTRDIEMLLRKDPGSLKPGGRWGTLIVRASERASGAVIEALIQGGASVNVHDDPKTSVDTTSGYTPLHAAAFNGNVEAVSVLLKHGANVQTREEKHHGTPAGWADYAGHREARDLILRERVDLIEVVQYGLKERARAIAQEDPNALNLSFEHYRLYPLDVAEGWYTPLAFAVALGQTDMVRILLELGAESTVRSPEGRTLYELAQERDQQDIADLLKAHAP